MAEKRDSYQWRGEEHRENGPCDKSDAAEKQQQREARSVTTPKDSKPGPGYERGGKRK